VLAADGLAPKTSLQISGSFIVPPVNPGWLSVIAVADEAGAVTESYTTNNRGAASLPITLADLTVSRLTLAPAHASAGDTVTATAVICNAGQVAADTSAVRLLFETASSVPARTNAPPPSWRCTRCSPPTPLLATIDALKITEAPSGISGSASCTVKEALHVDVEDRVIDFLPYPPKGAYVAIPAFAKSTSRLPFSRLISSNSRSRSPRFATSP
jgi:hypothetical protein